LKQTSTKSINRFSKFLLIAHRIDGYINFASKTFDTYEQAIKEVPQIFSTLEFGGEWDIQFYQIPDNCEYEELYGYYRVPKNSKLIFQYDYMSAGEEITCFMSHSLIHFVTMSVEHTEDWDREDSEQFDNYEIWESYLTVKLKESFKEKEIRNHRYKGDFKRFDKKPYWY
jgi:hypothetical protein